MIRRNLAWWGASALVLSVLGCSKPAAPKPESAPKEPAGAARAAPVPVAEPPKPVLAPKFTKREFSVDMGQGLKMEFVAIDPGTVTVGLVNAINGIARHDKVVAKPFYMGKYEVTQEQWKLLMGDNPSLHKNQPKNPVERVDWHPLQEFIRKMNAKYASTGMVFALPTEAQWEYACKAGSVVRAGSTDDRDLIVKYGWIGKNSDRKTHPVGQKEPNKWGLYDMHGNVAEFCADNASTDPKLQGAGKHVVRGGNYQKSETDCTSYGRDVRAEVTPLRWDGFRLICTPKN